MSYYSIYYIQDKGTGTVKKGGKMEKVKKMWIVAKCKKECNFVYSNATSILCKTKKEAYKLAEHLNTHRETTAKDFQIKDDEMWDVYDIGIYDKQPAYRLRSTVGKITVARYEPRPFWSLL